MQLSETGESRLRGYLYVFERSMKASAVSRDITADALREVESHIRDQIAELDAGVDERSALENILTRPRSSSNSSSFRSSVDDRARSTSNRSSSPRS